MTIWYITPDQTEQPAVNGDTIVMPLIDEVTIPYSLHISQLTEFTSLYITPNPSGRDLIGGSGDIRLGTTDDRPPQNIIFSAQNENVRNPVGITVSCVFSTYRGRRVWWVYDTGTYNSSITSGLSISGRGVSGTQENSKIKLNGTLSDVFYGSRQDEVFDFTLLSPNNVVLVVPATSDRIQYMSPGFPFLLDGFFLHQLQLPAHLYISTMGIPIFRGFPTYTNGTGSWILTMYPPSVAEIGLPDTGEGAENTGGLGDPTVVPDSLGSGSGGGTSSTNSGLGGSNYTGNSIPSGSARSGGGVPVPVTQSRPTVVPGNDGYIYSTNGDSKINLLSGASEDWSFNTRPDFTAPIAMVIEGSGVYGSGNSIYLGELDTSYTQSVLGTLPVISDDYQSIYQCFNPQSRKLLRTKRGVQIINVVDVDQMTSTTINIGVSIKAICPRGNNFIILAAELANLTTSRIIEIDHSGNFVNQGNIGVNANAVVKMFTNDNLVIIATPPLLSIYSLDSYNLIETNIIPNDILSTQICYSENNRFIVSNSNNSYGYSGSNQYPYPSCTLFSGLISASGCIFDDYFITSKYKPISQSSITLYGYSTALPSPYSLDRLGLDTSVNKIWGFTTIGGSSLFTYDLDLSATNSLVTNSQYPIQDDVSPRLIRIRDTGTQSQIYIDEDINAGNIPLDSYDGTSIIELSLYSTDKYDLRIYDD